MAFEILIIVALVLVNGVLAGAEIAVISVRPGRLRELLENGSGAARAALALREQPERFFATVQVGITVVSATAGAFGGATFASDFASVLARVEPLAPYAHELALAVVVTLISYLSLVFGELVPKSLALKAAEGYALIVARPLWALSVAMRPLIWFLTLSSNAVLRPFKDQTSFVESRISTEELVEMVSQATVAGTLNPAAGQIAARALDLPNLVASDVMVPRTSVVSLNRRATRAQLRQVILEHTHSRFPVVDGDLDHVVGYVSMKDVLNVAWEEALFVLEDLIRPAFFVPLNKGAVELLSEMRARRVPFAVVVDEHGAMEGIVTLEDVVEELVGEIFSEHAGQVPEASRREPDGSIIVRGSAPIRELNRDLELSLPEGEWATIAGLCLALAKRIPQVGDKLVVEGYELEVTEASPLRVRSVRLRPRAHPG